MAHISLIDKSMHKTYSWLYEIEEHMGWDEGNEGRALSLLKSTLHRLRDNLLINDLAHFAAQLPVLVRGLLFEAWNPDHTPVKDRKHGEFLAAVLHGLPETHKNIDIEEGVKAIFKTLYYKIDPLEVEKLKKVLPDSIKVLLP
ncbi:hypothetical protein I862_01005 [endosymbiont of Acanthamoeba sp. UWC8]|uniref:DUF2267 domain-containing protein n=1 Tax=endosymbiont of Acanthamoeba sp. UWC8 TaxID=86106 RepID=UPI0004D1BCF1|nr:DUF2267 domain-containing protein [endosymbiont of Acanthamoeba sp. UWC8]AIF80766.1 hypothetical protein I862_01005 [endosymbiont of Acanthamoeba sp. UWC8]